MALPGRAWQWWEPNPPPPPRIRVRAAGTVGAGVRRVRTQLGWASMASSKSGTVFLQPLAPGLARGQA